MAKVVNITDLLLANHRREENLVAAANQQVVEWLADPDVIRLAIRNGAVDPSPQLGDLLVAANREGRTEYRDRYLRTIGQILLQDITVSLYRAADAQLREEE